jgi:hypothetical protein
MVGQNLKTGHVTGLWFQSFVGMDQGRMVLVFDLAEFKFKQTEMFVSLCLILSVVV